MNKNYRIFQSLIGVIFTSWGLLGEAALLYEKYEGDYWHPTGIFWDNITKAEVPIPLECVDFQPGSFRLKYKNPEAIPFLSLTIDTPDFYDQISAWVTAVHLVPDHFFFKGSYQGKTFSRSIRYQNLDGSPKRVSLELVSIDARPDFESRKQLVFNSVMVRDVSGEIPELINILSSIPELVRGFPLKVIDIKKLAQEDIITIDKNVSGYVYGAEIITTTYARPHIPRIYESKGLRPTEDVLIYNSSSFPYKNPLGSTVLLKEALQVSDPDEVVFDENDDADTVAPPPSVTTVNTGVAQSVQEVEDPLVSLYYKRLGGVPHQVESPYLWSKDGQLFLTQTFEENCHALINQVVDPRTDYILRYVIPTSFRVTVHSDDTSIVVSPLLPGLYQFEGDILHPLNDDLTFKGAINYQLEPLKDPHIKGLQQSNNETTRAVYPFIGSLADFLAPDASTVSDLKTYEFLPERFRKEGLVHTVLSLFPSKPHLVVPFLRWAREQPDFYEHVGRLFCQGLYQNEYFWSEAAHGLRHYNTLKEIIDRPNSGSYGLHIGKFEGLKFLPLLRATDLRVYFSWPYDSSSSGHPQYNPSLWEKGPGGNRAFTEEHWEDWARAIRTNQFKKFTMNFYGPEESDGVFAIRPFTEAIKEQKILEEFLVPTQLGMANLGDLLVNGIGPNKSIKTLTLHVNGPRAFMDIGRMLEKNQGLEVLWVYGELVYDLEGLNLLGKSLRQNKTLHTLSLQLTLGCSLGYKPDGGRCGHPDEICRVSRAVPHGPGSVVGGVCKCRSCFEAFKAVSSTYDVNLDQFFDGIKASSIQDFTFYLSITTSNRGSTTIVTRDFKNCFAHDVKYWTADFPDPIQKKLHTLISQFNLLQTPYQNPSRFLKYCGVINSKRQGYD